MCFIYLFYSLDYKIKSTTQIKGKCNSKVKTNTLQSQTLVLYYEPNQQVKLPNQADEAAIIVLLERTDSQQSERPSNKFNNLKQSAVLIGSLFVKNLNADLTFYQFIHLISGLGSNNIIHNLKNNKTRFLSSKSS